MTFSNSSRSNFHHGGGITPDHEGKLTDQVLLKDDRAKQVLDVEGNKAYRTFQLERPRVFSAVAFNAEQNV